MGEDKDLEHHIETRHMGNIELDNAAVLLDVDAAKAGAGAATLKLAKDGHVGIAASKTITTHTPTLANP